MESDNIPVMEFQQCKIYLMATNFFFTPLRFASVWNAWRFMQNVNFFAVTQCSKKSITEQAILHYCAYRTNSLTPAIQDPTLFRFNKRGHKNSVYLKPTTRRCGRFFPFSDLLVFFSLKIKSVRQAKKNDSLCVNGWVDRRSKKYRWNGAHGFWWIIRRRVVEINKLCSIVARIDFHQIRSCCVMNPGWLVTSGLQFLSRGVDPADRSAAGCRNPRMSLL